MMKKTTLLSYAAPIILVLSATASWVWSAKVQQAEADRYVKTLNACVQQAYGQGQYDALHDDIRIKVTGDNLWILVEPVFFTKGNTNRLSLLLSAINDGKI